MKPLSDTAVRRARAASQLLYPTRFRPSAGGVVAHLLAVQAQDIGAAPLALRARTKGLTAADVRAARAERAIVRTWGPRGTLHLVARDDLGWLTPLMLGPWLTHAMTRLRQERVTGTTAKLVAIADGALAGQGPLTKQQFAARLAQQGCPTDGQGVLYMAFLAGIHGRAVLGPDAGNRPTYVHAEDWLGVRLTAELDRDTALAELARRYLRAHAPAGPEDLATWSKLPLRDARSAFRLAADDSKGGLVEVPHQGGPLWRLRAGTAIASSRPAPLVLLPAFDEYLLGWRGRALILPEQYAKRVVPGGGLLKPIVVVDGTVVGTWRPKSLRADLFGGGARDDDIGAEAADVTRFVAER